MKMQSSAPAQKVVGAAIGGGLAEAVVLVVIWLLNEYGGIAVPAEVHYALVIIVAAVGAYLSGYFVPPAARDQIVEK